MPAREAEDWARFKLGASVSLMLGWRTSPTDMDARPVRITGDIGDAFRDGCAGMLDQISRRERRTYSGIPEIDPGQYLSLGIEPEQDGPDAEPTWLLPQEMAATAQMLQLVDDAFERDDYLSRSELAGGRWLFYMVVVELQGHGPGESIAFVRRSSPQRGLGPGKLPVSARAATLTRFDDPFFNFDFNFDLVIAPDEIAILAVSAFNSVFADIQVSRLHVAENVEVVSKTLAASFADGSQQLLHDICSERAAFANRLRRIAYADHLGSVDMASMRTALKRHNYASDRLGGQEIELGDHVDVELMFDLLEGFLWEADFTGEGRRAVRFTVRR